MKAQIALILLVVVVIAQYSESSKLGVIAEGEKKQAKNELRITGIRHNVLKNRAHYANLDRSLVFKARSNKRKASSSVKDLNKQLKKLEKGHEVPQYCLDSKVVHVNDFQSKLNDDLTTCRSTTNWALAASDRSTMADTGELAKVHLENLSVVSGCSGIHETEETMKKCMDSGFNRMDDRIEGLRKQVAETRDEMDKINPEYKNCVDKTFEESDASAKDILSSHEKCIAGGV